MNFLSLIIFTFCLSLIGCSDHAHEHGSLHVHQPLRGGVLYELGKHGSGHNLELVTNGKGQLELFVLDAHAENYVRISQKQIDLEIIDSTNSITVLPFACHCRFRHRGNRGQHLPLPQYLRDRLTFSLSLPP